ncbi:MAG: phospho-sugar mutase, partial [Clostridia bacterium]
VAVDCSKLNDSSAKKDLSIVYTPLFGSGRDFVLDALEKDGFSQVHLVKKQAGFDGKFPGLRKPNPEEPEVFRIAEREALQEHADLMIATDPDSDRIGAGV